jgi:hypothetical protein
LPGAWLCFPALQIIRWICAPAREEKGLDVSSGTHPNPTKVHFEISSLKFRPNFELESKKKYYKWLSGISKRGRDVELCAYFVRSWLTMA